MSMSRESVPAEPLSMVRVTPLTPAVISIPADVAPFVGREREVETVSSILQQPTTRLLTVVGAGGVGKTRLVMRVASRLDPRQRRFDAIHFVPLGTVSEPEMVLVSIGLALGVRDGGMLPLKDGIGLAVRGREVLLILDTFEHVLAARPAVTDLLATCPSLTVVVTSRVPLRIYGEQIYRLAPMSVESSSATGGLPDAVRLFVDRGRAVRDDFVLTADNSAVIDEICTRLDGLPLAIELAAARLAVLSPHALRDRLDPSLPLLTRAPGDVPARQRTQRATIAWSYDLLTPIEQEGLRLLAHCAGGFGLGVFETMQDECEDLVALDMLEALVDANLVQQEVTGHDMRYRLLDTVREFGVEEAARLGETDRMVAQHAQGMLAWMLEVEPHLYNRHRLSPWLDDLQRELENVRQALRWFEQHDPASLARFSTALGQFWLRKSMLVEGRYWAQRTLDLMDPAPSAARVHALVDLGRMLMYQLDDGDDPVQREAHAMALALRDPDLQVTALIGRLTRCLIRGDRETVQSVMQDLDALLPHIRATDQRFVLETVLALESLGAAMLEQPDRVDELAVASLALQPAANPDDFDTIVAICRRAQAIAARQRNDAPRALWCYQDALRHYAGFGERWTCAVILVEIGVVVSSWAPHMTAFLYGVGDKTLGLLGLQGPFGAHGTYVAVQERVMSQIGADTWRTEYEAGYQAEMTDAIERARTLAWPATAVSGERRLESPRTPTGEVLTPREMEVLTLIIDGLTDREIAQELGVRYRTTTTFVTRILTKLDVPSRTAAATTAMRLGIVPGPPSR